MKNLFYSIYFLFFLWACSPKDGLPDVSGISVELSLIALEDEFRACKTVEQVQSFVSKYPKFAKSFLGYRPEEGAELVHKIVAKTTLPQYDTLYFACKNHLTGIDKAKDELQNAFRFIKYYYPEEHLPSEVYTIVSGYEAGADLFTDGEILVWGLEFCLGNKVPFRPPPQLQLHGYMLERMTPTYLPINYVLALSTKFNKYDILEQTMLADMIYYGKSYYFLQKIFPAYPDSLLIGFTEQQILDAHYNEIEIWGHFIKNELLYNTKASVKNRYLDERPKVSEIAEECPGRIGRWLGWQIVRAYMKRNPQITLQQLMEMKDAQKIFQESKYKPNPPRRSW